MGTHCNFAVIIPRLPGSYGVAIVRGVEASGNTGNVRLDHIATSLTLEEALAVAQAAQHVPALNFWAYGNADGNGLMASHTASGSAGE